LTGVSRFCTAPPPSWPGTSCSSSSVFAPSGRSRSGLPQQQVGIDLGQLGVDDDELAVGGRVTLPVSTARTPRALPASRAGMGRSASTRRPGTTRSLAVLEQQRRTSPATSSASP